MKPIEALNTLYGVVRSASGARLNADAFERFAEMYKIILDALCVEPEKPI